MLQDERVSAVAKRRRLNGTKSAGTNSPSIKSRSQSPAKPPTTPKAIVNQVDNVVKSVEVRQSENSFESLVTKDIVQFSHFREIEALSSDTIRIRLSKGQKCIVSGRFLIWVKQGVIQFHGARLEPSSVEYYIHASTAFESPAIESLANATEFEVRSHSLDLSVWTHFDFYEWIPVTRVNGNEHLQTSFLIHGYSRLVDGSQPAPIKEFDVTLPTDVVRRICHAKSLNSDVVSPTILICGKQWNGVSMFITSVINSLITAINQQPLCFGHGILFLDFDTEAPTYTTPGIGCLIHISRPILGSPFSHPPSTCENRNDGPLNILASQYVDQTERNTKLELDRFGQLLDDLKRIREGHYQNCPVIIKANSWLERTDASSVLKLAKRLSPDSVICCGAETDSNSGLIGNSIAAESKAQSCITIPVRSSRDPPSHVQNELLLQSYFCHRGYHLGCPTWSTLPLEADQHIRTWLDYGQENPPTVELHLPGMKSVNQDPTNTSNGYMVAIVGYKNPATNSMADTAIKYMGKPDDKQTDSSDARPAQRGHYFGLGIVAAVDEVKRRICVLTPIPKNIIEDHIESGGKIDLMAQKVDSDGCFDTGWVQLQLESSLPGRRPVKSICRRKLNIR